MRPTLTRRTLNHAAMAVVVSLTATASMTTIVGCHKQAAAKQPQTVAAVTPKPPVHEEPPTNPTTETPAPAAAAAAGAPAAETAATPTPAPVEPAAQPTAESTPTPVPTPTVETPATAPAVAIAAPLVEPAPTLEIPATMPGAAMTTTAPTTEAATPPPLNPAPPTTKPTEVEADKVLAERMGALALESLRGIPHGLDESALRQSAAILQAATKLDPTSPRFSRLWADAAGQLGDTDGLLAALQATRKSDPRDEFAQVRVIDLYASRMETAGERLDYLKGVLGAPTGVPESVRSHAGVLAARLLLDRGEEMTARNVLSEALRLNPLSVEGLTLRYDMLPPTASHFERGAALMAIMKANPAARDMSLPGRPYYTELLADEFADSALVAEAIAWYEETLKLSQSTADFSVVVKYAAELFLNDQPVEAGQYAQKLTDIDPNNTAAWFLRLAVAHSLGNQDEYNKTLQQARNVMANRIVEVANDAAGPGGAKATTRPITAEGPFALPDLDLTIAQINRGGRADLREAFVEAVSRMAMVEVYFAQQPDNATKLIDALKSVQPDDDPTVARLQGWLYLVQGKAPEAQNKFSAIAAQDPMAYLGLVRLTSDKQTAASMGRKLIADNPAGLIGAILWDALRPLGVKLVTGKQADALRETASQFPKDWLAVIDRPNTQPGAQRDHPDVDTFYAINITPMNVARAYGEPMLAKLTITNLTDNDLTIGADGLIRRDVWFNAQTKGVMAQNFAVTAVERLAGPLVLRGRQAMSQVVRLDQGPLAQLLDSEPRVAIDVYGTAFTNPMVLPNGGTDSGPGGYGVKFAKIFSRVAAPPDGPAPQKAIQDIDSGSPTQKINAINLLQAYVRMMVGAKDADKETRQKAGALANLVLKARHDTVPSVSAWAGMVSAMTIAGEMGSSILHDMAIDDDWRHRLGALLITTAPAVLQKELATTLSTDPEPSVRALAVARLAMLDAIAKLPATQPTSQPTTQSSAAMTTQP